MKKIFKIILKLIFLIILIGVVVAGYFIYRGYKMFEVALQEEPLKEKIEEIQNMDNYITISELPDSFKSAVISVEDRRFFNHPGIDLISISRAIFINIKNFELVEGGSTITQQIAKNIYFTQKKEIDRKVAECFMALEIEKDYSKNEILEIYINTNYYGSGYYGIYDASKGYFDKEPKDLNFYEATLLAGIPNAPSVYSPKVNPKLAEQRRKKVLSTMVECGYIDEATANESINSDEKTY